MAEAQKAVIRCPGCEREVEMPAASCPTCGFDFRAGRRPDPPALDRVPQTKPILYLGAAVVVMALIVIVFLLFGSDENAMDPPAALPGGGGSILQPVPDNPPPLSPLNPAKTIGRAQGAADLADERVNQARELAGE